MVDGTGGSARARSGGGIHDALCVGAAMEAAVMGVPALPWLLFTNQFYNEALLVGVVVIEIR